MKKKNKKIGVLYYATAVINLSVFCGYFPALMLVYAFREMGWQDIRLAVITYFLLINISYIMVSLLTIDLLAKYNWQGIGDYVSGNGAKRVYRHEQGKRRANARRIG